MARENWRWNRLCLQGWDCRKIACRVLLGGNVRIPHDTCSFYALSQILESHNRSGVRRKLERPLLMRSTICFLKFLLVVLVVTTFCAKPPLPPLPQLHHHHHYLKHFPFSFCRTIDAQDEYNFVSRMYVTVFLPLISATRSLTSPQKSFVQSQ